MTKVAAPGSLPLLELHTLGWKGFQDLSSTILAEVLGQTFSTFSPGKDGGRDGSFRGTWNASAREAWVGSFTVQCKHTSRRSASLAAEALNEEYEKVRALSREGLADIYVLLTNFSVTATAEKEICARLQACGARFVAVFGSQWISQKVYETPRLRMLVPRVYGLGDLSQILDERAYAQARSLLVSLRDELRRFVPTAAYRRAANALFEHRFCCLLGEPACGKSTIASVLSLHGIDIERVHAIKMSTAADFKRHWNPSDPRQLFWVDDVFGATQYDHARASAWNDVFAELRAAIGSGARVIFTSRDYIYRTAINTIKASAFPLLNNAQVVIEVEKLTQEEKEQILYNHVKLGNQTPPFRRALKAHLSALACRPHLLPEVARRLGDRQFTANLDPTFDELNHFADDPGSFLLETFRNLDKPQKALLALIFATGGVESPIQPGERELNILGALGCAIGEARDAAKSMRNSIVRLDEGEEQHVWIYRHPTMHDAFGSLLMEDEEMLDVYLTGANLDQVLDTVSCGRKIEGARVTVPPRLYSLLTRRLRQFYDDEQASIDRIIWFVYARTNAVFLRKLYEEWPEFHTELLSLGHYLSVYSSKIDILVRMHAYGILPEDSRAALVETLAEMALLPDAGFMRAIDLFSLDEKQALAKNLRKHVVIEKERLIADEVSNFERHGTFSPGQHFEELVEAFRCVREFLSGLGDSESVERLAGVDDELQEAIDGLEWDGSHGGSRRSGNRRGGPLAAADPTGSSRDRFDDLDE